MSHCVTYDLKFFKNSYCILSEIQIFPVVHKTIYDLAPPTHAQLYWMSLSLYNLKGIRLFF